LTAWLVVAGCSFGNDSSGGRSLQLRVQRVASPATTTPALRTMDAIGAYPWSSAVSFTTLQQPITAVTLYGTLTNGLRTTADVYACAGPTADDCLVDMTGPALANLLPATASTTLRPGTYETVQVRYCIGRSDTTEYAYVGGTVVLGGTTYYSTVRGTLDTIGPAARARVSFHGCSREYRLLDPVVVSPVDTLGTARSVPLTLRLLFDLTDIAWGGVSGTPFSSGCSTATGGSAPPSAICTGYMTPIGTVDSTPPTVERYRLNGGATLVLYWRARDDAPLGGYFRPHFDEGLPWSPGFPPMIGVPIVVPNTDGSYRLASDSSGNPDFATAAFRRANHTAGFSGAHGNGTYTAVRLP
jgi:hypothetical protein